MKNIFRLFLYIFASFSAAAADAAPRDAVDFSGYFRSGSGTNLHGGAQECFYNKGASANEMRLGNECGIYTELGLSFNHLAPTRLSPAFFKSQFRFAFSPEGYRLYDRIPSTSSSDFNQAFSNRGLNLVEVFVAGGNFSDFPLEAWIGKRFYRDADAYIHDWYYFADMNGVGAGIQKSHSASSWGLAHLLQGSETRSDKGIPLIQALDFRFNTEIASDFEFHLWSVYGWSPMGEDPATPTTKYVSGRGEILGVRLRLRHTDGFSDAALVYGHGLMSSLNLYGANPNRDEAVNKSSTWRFVLQNTKENIGPWSIHSVYGWESRDSGKELDARTEWLTVAVRPVLMISAHKQLAFELGHSRIRNESEYDSLDEAVGWRELTRVTIAPQLNLKKEIWGRPVMRVYYTQSFWNSANKSFVGISAPSFVGDSNGSAFGYQVEAWF